MSEFKIEVGKSYRTMDGRRVIITDHNAGGIYPYFGIIDGATAGGRWKENGHFYDDKTRVGVDLIAPWEETAEELCAADVSNAFNAQATTMGTPINEAEDRDGYNQVTYSTDAHLDIIRNEAVAAAEFAAHIKKTEMEYRTLRQILDAAFDQSAHGKGKERHANDKPFEHQPIMEIGRVCGPGFPAGQSIKKTGEALGMVKRGDREAAVRELLGAIVYAAATVALIREGGE